MMRAVLTSFGTAGDIQPFLALALELQRRGYRPVLAVSPQFEGWLSRYDVEVAPVGPDLREEINDVSRTALADPDLHGTEGGALALGRSIVRALPQVYRDLEKVTTGADVLISSGMQPAARMLHETTCVPFVSAHLTYVSNPGTRQYREATRTLIAPFRTEMGLPPLDDPFTRGADSSQLALYAMSRHVLAPPGDWPPHHHMTGFFFLDAPDWTPQEELEDFLAAGEAPVVISFGSNFHQDPAALLDTLLGSVARTGCRAVIQRGWSSLERRELPQDVLLVDYVPHDWLFPRASLVVHHGGIGTSAAVFRAGVPAVVVPHVFDQFLWAQVAEDLGTAAKAVDFRRLDESSLGDALAAALADGSLRRRARELGEKVRRERGVVAAADRITALLRRLGRFDESSDQTPRAAGERSSSSLDLREARRARGGPLRQLVRERQRARRKHRRADL